MVTVQVLGHLKMIDPAQIQSKPLHLCGECPSHHLGREVDQEILSLTLNIALGLRPRAIFQVRERISRSLPPFMKGRLQYTISQMAYLRWTNDWQTSQLFVCIEMAK